MDNFCSGMSTVVHIDRYNVLLTKVDAQCDELATVVGKLTMPATVDVRLQRRNATIRGPRHFLRSGPLKAVAAISSEWWGRGRSPQRNPGAEPLVRVRGA